MAITTAPLTGSVASVLTFPTGEAARIVIQVANDATAALTAFVIKGRTTSTAPFYTLASIAADYTSPTGIVVVASLKSTDNSATSPVTLATNTALTIILSTIGFESLDIQAAGSGAILTFNIGLRR